MKRGISLLLAVVLVCSMALMLGGCGSKAPANSGTTENGKLTWYMGGDNLFTGDIDPKTLFEGVADTIDPAKIYSSLTITEEMLYGAYTLQNPEKDIENVRKDIPFETIQFTDDSWYVAALPIAVIFGKDEICCTATNYNYGAFEEITDVEVAVLQFATEDKKAQLPCAYEVDGRNIVFKQITRTSEDNEPITYEYTGNEFTYSFSLTGPYLTFTKGGNSLKLTAYCLTENTEEALSMMGYSLPDSPLVDKLDYFSCSEDWNYAVGRDGTYYDRSAFKLTEDGRFTIYLAEEALNGEVTNKFIGQYAYIMQSSASSYFTRFRIILLDGEKAYYYTDDLTMREARALEDQGVDVGSLTDDQIEVIAKKKADLFDDLQAAFEEQGITATINRSMGEIALDSSVLFSVGESDISEEGQAFLQKFMQVYTSVVFGEKYEAFVSKIMVEGHTDTTGEYEMNQALSLARADSVKAYCLSEECGIDAAFGTDLQTMMESVGYAYDRPVYDESGEIDMDASRRVSFRFVINVEQAG